MTILGAVTNTSTLNFSCNAFKHKSYYTRTSHEKTYGDTAAKRNQSNKGQRKDVSETSE